MCTLTFAWDIMENLASIFGKGSWEVLKEMHLDIVRVHADTRACDLALGGIEYRITRTHHRRWHVATTGYWRVFGSQWDLLAWIGDRL